ncbi:MAG: zinc metalloprotease HtpX [Archaeoglobaceae archaeon]|nr:zinc metalloprotease HtpX [Archaeoglobaceae archaeon]MDW8127764.1 zinc metalloprotease HtpX [Archaeoglobaceae archaeon]
MFLIFDPLYWVLAILGYVVMFALASTVAPKVAGKFAGKFSLYTSMLLLLILILAMSAGVIYLILVFAGLTIDLYALLIFLLAINILIYLLSPYIINMSYGAKKSEELQRVVNEASAMLRVKPPKAVVVHSPPNAFAYGNFLTGKFVAVSDSLLNMLSRDELMAVIGHEIGHHKHRDNLFMLLLGLLPSLIFYLGYMLIRSSAEDRRGAQLAIVGILAVIVSFIIQVLVLAFSRLREYFADTEGVFVAGKEAMQRSLAKIHYFYYKYPSVKAEIAESKFRTLFIYALVNAVAEPFTRADIERLKKEKVSPIQEFLSTHPPIPKRLAFIDSLRF